MTKHLTNIRIVSFALITLMVTLMCCHSKKQRLITKGEQKSIQYCSSCHLYTPAELLDKTSWMNVLPQMKIEMLHQNIVVPDNDWSEIYAHYVNSAPFNLSQPSIQQDINFQQSSIDTSININDISHYVTLLECNQAKPDQVIVGTEDGKLSIITNDHPTNFPPINPIPVDIEYQPSDSSYLVLSMGEIGPQNSSKGKLQKVHKDEVTDLISNLSRPVHMSVSDIDNDNAKDYIISSFGSTNDSIHTGGLSMYSFKKDAIEKIQISNYTGATKSIIHDYNNDGKLDILALFSQGNERIILFENLGDLKFKEHILLQFHPLYGTLDFELQDINNDGLQDIILANGDNADYSQIFKPYHGLRIFQNEGDYKLKEMVFKHINGASKIELADINGDNKKDIVVLSSYPDHFTKSHESITFLIKEEGDFDYTVRHLNNRSTGNWLLCALCKNEQNNSFSLYLGSNNTVIRSIPRSLETEWKKLNRPLAKYNLPH